MIPVIKDDRIEDLKFWWAGILFAFLWLNSMTYRVATLAFMSNSIKRKQKSVAVSGFTSFILNFVKNSDFIFYTSLSLIIFQVMSIMFQLK